MVFFSWFRSRANNCMNYWSFLIKESSGVHQGQCPHGCIKQRVIFESIYHITYLFNFCMDAPSKKVCFYLHSQKTLWLTFEIFNPFSSHSKSSDLYLRLKMFISSCQNILICSKLKIRALIEVGKLPYFDLVNHRLTYADFIVPVQRLSSFYVGNHKCES